MSPRRPVIAVDFDGVLHSYENGWQGGMIYGDLMPGAKDGLLALSKRYELVCFTARHDLEAVKGWLRERGVGHLFRDVTNRKPAAVVYLDDRAVRFTDWDSALASIAAVA